MHMVVGCAREIKQDEYRVGMTPSSAREYIRAGHRVLMERSAGEGSGFSDRSYEAVGCEIVEKKDLFERADMVVKVKEPLEEEYGLLREGQILYTYLHLAANKALTEALLARGIKGVAYETVMEPDGTLPLLKPMSEIAGRLSIQEGAKYLEKPFGGRGILLGGVPGIARGKITILGGGVVGTNACKIAVGIGAEVTILDLSARRLEYLDDIFGSAITTLYSNDTNLEESLAGADLVIGAVLIPGAAAPKLIRREHLKIMKKGAVIVDVAGDQGGCCETTKPTYHNNPIFIVDGIVHYCVANMPGVVALSATNSLTSVTTRHGVFIASNGLEKAMELSTPIRAGVNLYEGALTNRAVAEATGLRYRDLA
jgi:alanine dehydrogenase